MTLVTVVETPLPLWYLRRSDIESDIVSREVGGVPVGVFWVETECLCPLKVVLVVGLTSALTWVTTVGLATLAQEGACCFIFLNLLENSCYQTKGD